MFRRLRQRRRRRILRKAQKVIWDQRQEGREPHEWFDALEDLPVVEI